jgi:hypothetical protein
VALNLLSSTNVDQSHQSHQSAHQSLYVYSHTIYNSFIDFGHSLLGAGYSLLDIANATLEVERIKKMRAESIRNQKWDGVNAFVQYTGKSLRRMITPKPAGAMSA